MIDHASREIEILAKLNGCNPQRVTRSLGTVLVCTCPGNVHGVSLECCVISRDSAQRYVIENSAPRTLTRDEALVIGTAVPAKGKAIERAAKRWGGATLYKCRP